MPGVADRSAPAGGLTMALEPRHVDGNAVAGAFAEVFGIDVTTVVLACHVAPTASSRRILPMPTGQESCFAARRALRSLPVWFAGQMTL